MTRAARASTRPDDDRAVVVGADGSEAAGGAARAAAEQAVARHVPLVLVRAFDWPGSGVRGLPAEVDGRAVARRSAAADLQRLAASITDRLPRCDVRTELLDGPPGEVLCARSADAALVVVGAHGQTWSSGTALGSVASAVAHGSACPVLLHRTANALSVQHTGVTVGIDGGPGSGLVLAAAAREARQRGVALTVAHAWRHLTQDATRAVRWLVDPTAPAETSLVEDLTAELRLTHPELPTHAVRLAGRAGPALVAAGDTAALVVVGRPAVPSGQEQRPTTHDVASRARVPVLLVPLPAMDRADQPVLADRA